MGRSPLYIRHMLTMPPKCLRFSAFSIWVVEDLNQPPIVSYSVELLVTGPIHTVDVGIVNNPSKNTLNRPAEMR